MQKASFLMVLAFATFTALPSALADIPNDPCTGKADGDACTLDNGDDGVCDSGTCVADDDDGCSVGSLSTSRGRLGAIAGSICAVLGVAVVLRQARRRQRR
ncbi:MAG: hypothetical protein U0271_19080 [Polyangiaceae bacterium]